MVFFQARQWAALSSFKVRKKAFSWKMVGFRHKPDINPVIRGKNTKMWPLLNKNWDFSVLKKKKKKKKKKKHWKGYQL